jgi:hypothetical protein
VSRLADAHRAAERLRARTPRYLPQYRAELDAITLALGRMAQLEKVAELARQLPPAVSAPATFEHPMWLLELALIELDHHPDTREPTTIVEKDR